MSGARLIEAQTDAAPSHIASDTVAKGSVLTHLPLRGQRRNRGSTVYKCAHSPASLFHSVDPWVTEHLEQAAKVSGLGVERQLKLALYLNHPPFVLLYPYRYQGENHA